jgi:hypothetical protein
MIHLIIMFSSGAWIIVVISTKLFLEWPLTLISLPQAASLQLITDAVTMYIGALATVSIVAVLPPVMAAWFIDVTRFRSMYECAEPDLKGSNIQGKSAEPIVDDDGLNFAPISIATGALAVVAPVIASPIVDAVKHLLSQN